LGRYTLATVGAIVALEFALAVQAHLLLFTTIVARRHVIAFVLPLAEAIEALPSLGYVLSGVDHCLIAISSDS